MSKQTAVEWIEIELKKKGFDFPYVTLKIEQAKAMEREQIIKAFCEGYDHDGDNYDGAEISYYNKTYKGGNK
jgi:hypothetical protein